MTTCLFKIDDEVQALIKEIGARLGIEDQEVVAIAVALLAARMRIRVVE